MGLPHDAKARKDVPLYTGLIKYFPRALAKVAELSRIGNDQHNPGQPLHWDRSKSGDELDALARHLFEAGMVDSDNVSHSTKVAWRALANLEKEEEAKEAWGPSSAITDHPAHWTTTTTKLSPCPSDTEAYNALELHYRGMQQVIVEGDTCVGTFVIPTQKGNNT